MNPLGASCSAHERIKPLLHFKQTTNWFIFSKHFLKVNMHPKIDAWNKVLI